MDTKYQITFKQIKMWCAATVGKNTCSDMDNKGAVCAQKYCPIIKSLQRVAAPADEGKEPIDP